MQNTPFSTNKTLNISGRIIDLAMPRVMGVLNVTPDSFYDGGLFMSEKAIVDQVEKMIREGADFIDVGGYSSRPRAEDISEDEEKKRILIAIGLIARNFPGTIVSVDTFRSSVAEAAVDAGAAMVNDIAGGDLDDKMFETVSRLKVPYVIMHMRGNPQTMTSHTGYTSLLKEVIDALQAKIYRLRDFGVSDIIVDPGFGFAKTRDQSFHLLHHLEKLAVLGKPVLAGLSRKSMIWKTLDIQAAEALNGTTALNMIALLKGSNILRVHDVKEAKEVIKLFNSFNDSSI